MLNQLKKVARQTAEADSPAMFLFGVVTAADPLKILVDSRFEISGEALVVPRELRAGEHPTHTHAIEPHTHTVPPHTTQAAGEHAHSVPSGGATAAAGNHTHPVGAVETGAVPLVTAAERYTGLAVGEKVILLRNQGGQQYLVLGRG